MKHTRIIRIITVFLLCTVFLSVLCIIPVSAVPGTVTVGVEMTSIGPDDMEEYKWFEGTIVIDEGVTEIKADTFQFFKAKEIKLPSTLKTIGNDAFYCCMNISELTIPENVTTIGNGAFDGCSDVKTMYYNAKNCTYKGDTSSILGYPNYMSKLVIGLNVETIPAHAFQYATSLNYLTIPGNVKSIGENAFYGCEALQALKLEDGIEVIGVEAFSNCSSLTEITIPASVTEIGYYAFLSCSKLKNVHIEDPSLLKDVGLPNDTLINGKKQPIDLFEFLENPSMGSDWGVFFVVYVILLILLLLCGLAVNIIFLIGNLKLNNRYRCITGKDAAWMTGLAVILSLIGFGMWYMLVIAIINHSEAQKLQ